MHGLEASGWLDRITAISQFRKWPETVTFAGCAEHTSLLDLATRKGQSRQSSIAFRGTADDSESENRVAVLRLNDEIGVFWALERPESTSLKKSQLYPIPRHYLPSCCVRCRAAQEIQSCVAQISPMQSSQRVSRNLDRQTAIGLSYLSDRSLR